MNEKITNRTLLQLALVAGITILASVGVDGWGWLVFALICTL
jgi:hypothetical protein